MILDAPLSFPKPHLSLKDEETQAMEGKGILWIEQVAVLFQQKQYIGVFP